MSTLSPVEVLRLLIEEDQERTEFRPSVLLNNIQKDSWYQTLLDWNASLGGAEVSGRGATEDVGAADATDQSRNVNLPIGDRVLGHNFGILRTKITEAKNVGVGRLKQLFQEHVNRAYEVISTNLSQVLYTGDGTAGSHGIIGIANVAAQAAYGGIATTTYPEWSCTVAQGGTPGTPEALTKTRMDDHWINLKRRGVMPSRIYTTPEVMIRYEDIFNSERSLTVNQVNGVADLGFSGHSYRRIPFVEDTQCPNNTAFWLDFSKLKLYTYHLEDVRHNGKVVGTTTDFKKTMNLNFRIAEVTNRNPDLLEIEISLMPQLQIRQPKCVGPMEDITQ